MNLPTNRVGEITGQRVAFEYGSGDSRQRIELPPAVALVSVVEPELRKEAVASINQSVYGSSWGTNNLGILKRGMREQVASGDIAGAKGAVSDYRARISAAEAVAGSPIATEALRQELSSVEAELDEAQRGDISEQKEKQNRLGKKLLKDGLNAQRSK